tara:strand:- start:247 stop:444 length:198 start_codon:yes stop_codon:yes gene_type:complete
MKTVPDRPKNKSLIKTSGDEVRFALNNEFRNWARSKGIVTRKEMDTLSKVKLQNLYIEFLKDKGQ